MAATNLKASPATNKANNLKAFEFLKNAGPIKE